MDEQKKKRAKPRRVLIDADIVAYKAASAAEKAQDWEDGIWTLHATESDVRNIIDSMVGSILIGCKAKSFLLFITGKTNFRYTVDKSYKHNRKEIRRPMLLQYAREYLNCIGTVIQYPKLEADDCLGIFATNPKSKYQDIISSEDKDLKTIPGLHYDKDLHRVYTISKEEADRKWFMQVLTGDNSDGYPGCPGSGPKDAEKVLSELSMHDTLSVWKAIVKRFEKAKLSEADALVQARLSRILRYGEYDIKAAEVTLWNPPTPDTVPPELTEENNDTDTIIEVEDTKHEGASACSDNESTVPIERDAKHPNKTPTAGRNRTPKAHKSQIPIGFDDEDFNF